MFDLDYAINFYRRLADQTSVGDSKDFYEQVAVWLADYKNIKDGAVVAVESSMQCSCCGSRNLYEGVLESDGGGIYVSDSAPEGPSVSILMRQARCCRDCGNVMPYVPVR